MLVDELEVGDVALVDAAISGRPLEHDPHKAHPVTPRIADGKTATSAGSARGALAGALLGAALWAGILVPVLRH